MRTHFLLFKKLKIPKVPSSGLLQSLNTDSYLQHYQLVCRNKDEKQLLMTWSGSMQKVREVARGWKIQFVTCIYIYIHSSSLNSFDLMGPQGSAGAVVILKADAWAPLSWRYLIFAINQKLLFFFWFDWLPRIGRYTIQPQKLLVMFAWHNAQTA